MRGDKRRELMAIPGASGARKHVFIQYCLVCKIMCHLILIYELCTIIFLKVTHK